MKKRRRIRSSSGKTALPELPEAMIQEIQSYMSGKEAARTTLLSKSWHAAWLTRPRLDFDFNDLGRTLFEEYATKTVRRYQESCLKIESFKLRSDAYISSNLDFHHNLIVEALKLGANDVDVACFLTLPPLLLASQNLLRLTLAWCTLVNNAATTITISFPKLKSLTFDYVNFTSDDVFYRILASCRASIEELSLSNESHLGLGGMSLLELHKLRRLVLFSVEVDVTMFSNDFASRFPCLNELSIRYCRGCNALRIDSPSLQTISFALEHLSGKWRAEFDVPNIRRFSFSDWRLPSSSKLSIKAAVSREWEFDISMFCFQLQDSKWFMNLRKYMKKYVQRYTLSRISFSLILTKSVYRAQRRPADHTHDLEVHIEVAPKPPLVVDSVMIDGPPEYRCALLVRLFGICRPKFITYCPEHDDDSLDFLWKGVGQTMFGQLGLKEVTAELLDASQTPANKQRIRYHLIYME